MAENGLKNVFAFAWGSVIGVLGGLIGLGGAEFRLPVLVGIFRYGTLQAIIINLLVSLVTVVFSFFFRVKIIPVDQITAHFPIILNILAGSLVGSYWGVSLAAKINERLLTRVVIGLLVFLSGVLIGHNFIGQLQAVQVAFPLNVVLGVGAGVVIGLFSSMLGVAGGELIIPTIMLIYGVNIKLAGSLGLAISMPTLVMGLAKYHKLQRLQGLSAEYPFMAAMAAGSVLGALGGSYLLSYAPGEFLHLALGVILALSAFKLSWHHKKAAAKG
jgi:uncharacterized membrane protein YfcA